MYSKEISVYQRIASLKSAAVAFSGGVDSTLLLKLAAQALGPNVLAVTFYSPIHSTNELTEAKQLAKALNVRHEVVQGKELEDPSFRQNTPERCYICKTLAYKELHKIAQRNNLHALLDGTHIDDANDFRPGLVAARKAQVISPFLEAGMSKSEIINLAARLKLPNWNKPSLPCLCTRIPYGEPITIEKLQQIDKSEEILRTLGFSTVRVRHHDLVARIEVRSDEIERLVNLRREVSAALKELGFKYVSVDLDGFRSGSMNESLLRK